MVENLQRLLRLGPDEFKFGVTPSVPDLAGAPIQDSRNLFFDELSMQPMPGMETFYTKPSTKAIVALGSLRRANEPVLYFAYRDAIYSYSVASGVALVTAGFTGTDQDLGIMESWGNWMLYTNNVDPPKVDKGAGAGFVNLGGSPPSKINILRKFRVFGIGFGTSNDPNEIIWTDDDDIEDWVSTIDNYADSFVARDMDSAIVGALPLADMIAYYSRNEMRALRFLGFPNTFGEIKLLRGLGLVGKHAGTVVGQRHFGWGWKGIWVTDGVSVEYIDNPAIRDYIQSGLNRDYLHLVTAVHLPQYRRVLFFHPEKGEVINTQCMVFNYNERAWEILSFGRSPALEDSEFNYTFFGSANGDVWRMGIEHTTPYGDFVGVTVTGTATLETGYGEHDYGLDGYGGTWSLNG